MNFSTNGGAVPVQPQHRGKLWSPEEDQQLLTELRNGLGISTIANTHGRTDKAIELRVMGMIQKSGVPVKTFLQTQLKISDPERIRNFEKLWSDSQSTLKSSSSGSGSSSSSSLALSSNIERHLSDLVGIMREMRDMHRLLLQEMKLLRKHFHPLNPSHSKN